MNKVFRKDVWICATAYVVAESEEAATLLFDEAREGEILFSDGRTEAGDLMCVDGAQFEYLEPGINLSPAMTFYGDVPPAHSGQPVPWEQVHPEDDDEPEKN